jgi:ABC-2 type transport system permease protein
MMRRSVVDKLLAVMKRDALIAIRHHSGFWLSSLGIFVELAAFYYLSRAVGTGFKPEGMGFFPFLLVGTGVFGFLLTGITGFVTTVQEAQQTGTFEILMTTSTPPALLVVLSAMSAFAGRALFLMLYMASGLLLFGIPIHQPNLLACFVVLLLSVVLGVAIGIGAAAVQVSTQKGGAALWALGSGGWFLTGTIFPVDALPRGLRQLAELIPITHSLDAMRMALLQSATFAMLGRHLLILGTFSVVLLPISIVLFSAALASARRQGTLSFY